MRINLLPLEYRPQPLINPMRLVMMIIGSCLFFITILVSLFYYLNIQNSKVLLDGVNKELEILRPSEEKLNRVEQLASRIDKNKNEIEQIKNNYQNYVDNISNVVVSLPEQLWLRKFELNNNGKISIEGSTLDFVIVGHFLNRLEENDLFNKVKLNRIEETRAGEENNKMVYYNYSIELGIGGVKE
ncbi:MAG TPA: PilN domain-containing protein [Bacillota bacterium]|jgi:Tfp pilus assembly protein PilN|nr:PilN domain-containing protein [Bacillota bacterium]HOL09289.1 PilN domain-containing protein [Bacillota bacterium]HPO96952.1 PilN domain-containing protein [Bacillota bacterium]